MTTKKMTDKVSPREFFRVADHVNYLEPVSLQCLEKAFEDWKDGASRVDSLRGRARMWLVFLLLRHTGARLGEILSLDDTDCFDPAGPSVRLGSDERKRNVPIPEEVYAEITGVLEGQAGYGLRGEFFRVDQGYFRRTCYARGKECGLSKEQVNPKALRNTRAVEMLRNGVPITVVRDVLGQSSLDLTAGFQQFSAGDMESIVRSAQESMRKQTSARNSFAGHVTRVVHDEVMAEVELETRSGLTLSSVITESSRVRLRLAEGSPVLATVKAPLVNVLAGEEHVAGSARNRFPATVVRVTDSPVICEVLGRLEDGTDICALISADSAKSLSLKSGDRVEFWFKALSVVLNTIQV